MSLLTSAATRHWGGSLRRNHAIEAAGEIRRRTVEEIKVRGAGGEVGQVRPCDWIPTEIGRCLHAIVLADGQRDFRGEACACHRDGSDESRSSRDRKSVV